MYVEWFFLPDDSEVSDNLEDEEELGWSVGKVLWQTVEVLVDQGEDEVDRNYSPASLDAASRGPHS